MDNMDKKESYSEEENNEQELEKTKEVITLRDLSLEALDVLNEDTSEEEQEVPIEDLDENMEQADLVFKTEVETKEEVKKELAKEKKENIFKKLQKKWKSLTKKQKIIAIVIAVVVVILLAVGIFFLVTSGKDSLEDTPDVILEGDNYRYENGTLIFLDGDTEIGRYECEHKDETLCEVAYLTDDDEFDKTKRVDENGNDLVLRSQIYHNRYVFVTDRESQETERIILYDMEAGSTVQELKKVKAYDDDYVAIQNNENLYGLAQINDGELKMVIPYEYDELGVLPDQEEITRVMVEKDGNEYISDLSNKVLTKAFSDTIAGATDRYVKTKDDEGKYHVYDYNVTELQSDTWDYVVLLENYMIGINNKQLYVINYEGSPMNHDGILLNNDKYNPIETYEELKLVNTEKSFDYELTGSLLNINVYNGEDKENHSINLNEGRLSSSLAYLEYFDGKLYLYSDQDKTTLIGSYPCDNKNEINNDTTTLDRCRIASESFYRETTGNNMETDESSRLGWIPIIGKRYGFIQDGDTIVLYDFTDSKKLATYTNVDTRSYTSTNEITFTDASSVSFIAQSKNSGKFGVARISSGGVTPLIAFEADSIKGLGNYYVVSGNGTYALYDLDGTKKTDDKASPIVDYHGEYLKTYKDGNYYIHKFDGSVSDSNSHTYIELYDNYYVTVDNKDINIYNYDGENLTENLSSGTRELLKVQTDTFYGSGTKAFTVTFSGEYANVLITTSSGGQERVVVPLDNSPVTEEGDDNLES